MIAMNPLKEMVTSNKQRRGWYVLNKKREGTIVGLMNESPLGEVFTERLYKAMVPQGISDVRYRKADGNVGVVGGRNVILEGERYLHSAAGKGLR